MVLKVKEAVFTWPNEKVQIVDRIHRNNLVTILFLSNWMIKVQDHLKSMVISILLNIRIVKFLKTLHTVFIVQKQLFQIKILNEMEFF